MSTVTVRRPAGVVSRLRLPSWWLDATGVLIAVLVAGGPALFTNNGFALDFTNHLWLVSIQEYAISHHLAPTYFISAPFVGVFYPFFLFYGGTLYAATGALAAILGGDVVAAYVVSILLSIAAAYGGCLWLARQLGVRSWMAHAPAITFVASAYYITNLYGRGAWPEVVATSAYPLVLASGLRLARSPRIEPAAATLFVLSVVFFAGSHNITLMLGTVVAGLGAVLVAPFAGRQLLPRNGRRALAIAGLAALGLCLDAWYLLPDILYAGRTQVGSAMGIPTAPEFDTFGTLFNPLRSVPRASGTPGLYVQLPVWLLAWALAAGVASWRGASRRLRLAACGLLVLLTLLVCAMLSDPLWTALPRLIQEAQFTYRLVTYMTLCIAGLVLIAVLRLERAGRGRLRTVLTATLSLASAITVAICIWQLWVPNLDFVNSYHNRSDALASIHLAPQTWYDASNYLDASQPVVPSPRGTLIVKTSGINADHVTLTETPPAGGWPFVTDIAAGPYAVKVSGGLVRAGRSKGGDTVARRTVPGAGPVTFTLALAGGWITVGRIVTIIALIVAVVLAAFAFGGWLALRGRPRVRR